MAKIEDCKFELVACRGFPAYLKCYDKSHNNKCVAWAIIIMYPSKAVDLVHIYVFPSRRREGYAQFLIEAIKIRSKAIFTDWEASSEESREMCQKAGMKRENIKGRELLVWREPAKEGEKPAEVAPPEPPKPPEQSKILTMNKNLIVPKPKIIISK